MRGVFYIVGPTATGKSEIAADVAGELDADIVSGDAFQIYRGLDLLSAKPDAGVLKRVRHHLVGAIPLLEEMNAEKFRRLALQAIREIHSSGKLAMVVGGSGLYIKALTHGLPVMPSPDPDFRARLNQLSLADLQKKLYGLDPKTGIDLKNRRRVMRAIEICMLSGRPASTQRVTWSNTGVAADVPVGNLSPEPAAATTHGIFVFREREDLYQRINQRTGKMFEKGVIEEVCTAGATSETASKMIGLGEIRELLDGKMSVPQCVAAIQRATRRYAKRQLTWFRRQTNFQSLNLSVLSHVEAVKRIAQLAKTLGVAQGND
jgi:tRNA dimethylallyltransferase